MTKYGQFDTPQNAVLFDEYYKNALEMWSIHVEILHLNTSFGVTRVLRIVPPDPVLANEEIPAVLLHGYQGTSLMWQRIQPMLSQKRTCYAIDIMGQVGGSIPDKKSIRSIEQYVEWLREVILLLGTPRNTVHVIGYAYGGYLACRYAVKYPSEIKCIILIEPAVVFNFPRLKFLLSFLGLFEPASIIARKQEMEHYLQKSSYYNPYAKQAISFGNQHFLTGKLVFPKLIFPWKLAKFKRRLVIIIGGRSEMLNLHSTRMRIKFFTPQARVVEFENGTHAVGAEYAYEVSNIINKVFAEYH